MSYGEVVANSIHPSKLNATQLERADQIIARARKILAAKSRWVQGTWALTKKGREVRASHKDAVCFCAEGALQRAGYELFGNTQMANTAIKVVNEGTGVPVFEVNDADMGAPDEKQDAKANESDTGTVCGGVYDASRKEVLSAFKKARKSIAKELRAKA